MSKITQKQKETALANWGDDYPELPEKYLDWAIRKSARHIYVDHDNNGWCTHCETKVMLPKTKHLQDIKCPNCRRELKALHVWRRTPNTWGFEGIIDWYVFPENINEHTLMLRYVVVDKYVAEPEVRECARLIMDFEKKKEYTLERRFNNWNYSTHDYFREHNMSWDLRKWCCLPAKPYPYTLKRLNKINDLAYIRFNNDMFRRFYVSGVLGCAAQKADLYEKLTKADMYELVRQDLSSYSSYDEVKYDTEQTSLIKMLGLNRNTFRLLRQNQTVDALNWLRKNPDASQDKFDRMVTLNFSTKFEYIIQHYSIREGKTYQYISKHTDKKNPHFLSDYVDYLRVINELGYPLDNQYLYPSNFRKADERVNRELTERRERRAKMTALEKVQEEARIDATVNKISQLLRENEDLKRFMIGSSGLKVIVPSSVGELIDEGIKLHNCLQTYDKKIADKQCLIFFIHKINDPDKAYIAMEYRNGKCEQLRLDNNQTVTDEKIISFADALTRQLNKANIMNQIRREAA